MYGSKKFINLSINSACLFLLVLVFETNLVAESNPQVFKHVLANGLTVLVKPNHLMPEVTVRMFYYVGSKDEESGERGIAHLIEHMIFKGTERLSETDICDITDKLSGYCNAHTSQDYTCYDFNFPTQHWQISFDILADCMCNCAFKQEVLNSELKAVIQELKMRRDNYPLVLWENMTCAMFEGHPYANPIIGYKHDLWSLNSPDLVKFYKKHYVPNNATLVVVGDVTLDTVVALAEKHFGAIPANPGYQKKRFYVPQDLMRRSLDIYRAVQCPRVMLAYRLPNYMQRPKYLPELIGDILGNSILTHKLRDELQLVTSISAGVHDLFDGGIFAISYIPKDHNDTQVINKINRIIQDEVDAIVVNGISENELCKATKSLCLGLCHSLGDNYIQANEIGRNYLTLGDENYLYNYLDQIDQVTVEQLQKFGSEYLINSKQCKGKILPLSKSDQAQWLKLQELSDFEDQRVLEGKIRDSIVGPGIAVHQVQVQPRPNFKTPVSQKSILDNGLEVLYFNNPSVVKKAAKIDLVLELKTDHYYDPASQMGLCNFVMKMLLEGTKNYTKQELHDLLGLHGMSIDCEAGKVTMSLLSGNLKLATSVLQDILTNSLFEERAVEAVRARILAEIKQFWDSPRNIANYLVNQAIYPDGHPYRYLELGNLNTIASITRADLIRFYQKLISPQGARLAIVGDLGYDDLAAVCHENLAKWSGEVIPDIQYPDLNSFVPTEINYPLSRDQVILAYVGPSISRLDPDWLKMRIFDEIFSNSHGSKLFKLREESGLFYWINGSLISGATKQPGICAVWTMVSCDRLAEAERKIKQTIDHVIVDISDYDLYQAKEELLGNVYHYFKTNLSIANTFLLLRRFDLPDNYFELRSQAVVKLTKEDLQQAANRVLNSSKMATIRVGRV